MSMSVPSTKNRKALNEYKKNLTLSQEQKDIIIGTLLGDGSLRHIGKFSRLVFEQKNAVYLYHLYDIFKAYTRTPPQERKQKRLLTSDIKSTWYFSTISHWSLHDYYEWFYPQGKKIVPLDIKEYLTPRVLAYWFMDDGSKKESGYTIATCGFTPCENKELVICLKDKFDLDVNIQGKKYEYLYIKANSASKFKKFVEPYIVESMKYKL